MAGSIIVSEVDGPLDVVRCFVRKEDGLQEHKRQLVVVGLERIDVFAGVEQNEPRKVLSLRTDGCTVAAFYYRDHSVADRRFFILLKATGRLDFIDLEYKLVKSLETEIDQVRSEPKFLFQDPLRSALVFNLSCTEIYEIPTDDILGIVQADIKLSYITSSPIVSIDACVNFNDILDKDAFTLSILTHAYGANEYNLEACVCVFKPKPAETVKWQRTTNVSFTDEAMVSQILLKSVANIGHFVFTPLKTYFIKHAPSSKQTIKGEEIGTIYLGSGAFESGHGEAIYFLRPIFSEVTLNYLAFMFMTDTGTLITCKLNAILSSFEDDTYIWESFVFERPTTDNDIPLEHYLSAFFDEKYWMLVSPKGYITMNPFGDCNHSIFVTFGSLLRKSTLYSDFTGNYIRSHLSCGSLYNGQGFLSLKSRSFVNIFAATSKEPLFQTRNCAPLQVYPTKKGIYWVGADSFIYKGSNRISAEANDNFIVTRDGTLLKDKSIVTLASIEKDEEFNYVYVTKQGHLKWSHLKKFYQIQNVQKSLTIENCCLSAISRNDSILTVLVLNDEVMVFDSCNQLRKQNKTFNRLSNISSVFLYEYEKKVYILISDVEGNLCVIDASTLEVLEEVKICKKKLQFCGVPNSDYVLIFTPDTIVLFKPSVQKGEFDIQEVYTPYHISHLVPGINDSSVIMATFQGKFYDVTVPSDVGEATFSSKLEQVPKPCLKFINLESSSRYIFVAALPIAQQMHDNYSEIYVYDIKQIKRICTLDFCSIDNDIKSIKYENVLITDMISVPLLKRKETLGKKKASELYKEVIFNSCILVSLNLNPVDEIDSNEMKNLMLFSFDEKSGTIEYLFGINAGFSITGLYNYYNGCILAYGESIQAYQLNYSVHENKFSIEHVSNRLDISGVAITSSIFFEEDKIKMAKKQQNINTWVYSEKMVLLDVRKGMTKINIIHTTDGSIEKIQLQVQSLDPLERELINSTSDRGIMFTGVATATFNGTRYLLTSYGGQRLTLFSFAFGDDDEIDQNEIDIAAQVTAIKSVGITQSSKGTFLGRATFTPFFLVTTLGNGCYVIGFLHEESYKPSTVEAALAYMEDPKYLGFLDPRRNNHDMISER
ncbi:hypothetical protein N7582_003184 [Saccharomyces uvarum]|uniref:Uncharacterized protein n=1 Tax=Saccharomyces uvarum TaxID=230603 RepID=A0AA35NJ17_SACUV|nr:hypothetical protein N7582_003184 [Saccharomyces uvarum]CAI4044220.1 hypothetical protein SUVC_10G1250 [Saccharomyces uvarum]